MASGPPPALGPVALGQEGVVDMFCRILVSVDEDLVTLDIPRCVCLHVCVVWGAWGVCGRVGLGVGVGVGACACARPLRTRSTIWGSCKHKEDARETLCLTSSARAGPPLTLPHIQRTRRSQNESKLSMHVKDSMREHSITDVAAAWWVARARRWRADCWQGIC